MASALQQRPEIGDTFGDAFPTQTLQASMDQFHNDKNDVSFPYTGVDSEQSKAGKMHGSGIICRTDLHERSTSDVITLSQSQPNQLESRNAGDTCDGHVATRPASSESIQTASHGKSPLRLKRQVSALSLSISRQKLEDPRESSNDEFVDHNSELDSHSSDCSTYDIFAKCGTSQREPIVIIGGFDTLKNRNLVSSPTPDFMDCVRAVSASPILASPVRLYPRPPSSVINLASPHNAVYEQRERKANAVLLKKQRERRAREAGIVLEEEPAVKPATRDFPELVQEYPPTEQRSQDYLPAQKYPPLAPESVELDSSQELTATEDKPTKTSDWVRDAVRPACVACGLLFRALFRRRHHCRVCLEVFCSACSSKTIERDGVQQRACHACHRQSRLISDPPPPLST